MGLLDSLFGGGGGGGGMGNFSGGGVGNSASESKQQTENNDMRVVGGDSSVNTSTSIKITGGAGPTNVTTTDYGSVAKALMLGQVAVQGAQSNELATVKENAGILDSALHTIGDQQAGFTSALENIKTNDKTLAIGGAVIVAALAAVFYFGKR